MNRHERHSVAAPDAQTGASEDGYLLLGAIVAIALVLLVLGIAAPRVARELRREREEEAVHRANQYVRAIQLYYRRFGHYPGSVDQLMNTNNIRFLRQRYTDPITGKDDFRTIPVGQNKTTVKTFFGKPLAGISTTGVGSVGGMLSTGIGTGGPIGSNTASASPPGAAAGGLTATLGAAPASADAPANAGAVGGATGATGGTGATGATGSTAEPSIFSGSAQPFMGVGLSAKGDSIIQPNGQTTYERWEFLYDPRLDQLKARAAALNGGGVGSVPANALGASGGIFGSAGSTGATGSNAATPGSTNSTAPPAPTSAGSQP